MLHRYGFLPIIQFADTSKHHPIYLADPIIKFNCFCHLCALHVIDSCLENTTKSKEKSKKISKKSVRKHTQYTDMHDNTYNRPIANSQSDYQCNTNFVDSGVMPYILHSNKKLCCHRTENGGERPGTPFGETLINCLYQDTTITTYIHTHVHASSKTHTYKHHCNQMLTVPTQPYTENHTSTS